MKGWQVWRGLPVVRSHARAVDARGPSACCAAALAVYKAGRGQTPGGVKCQSSPRAGPPGHVRGRRQVKHACRLMGNKKGGEPVPALFAFCFLPTAYCFNGNFRFQLCLRRQSYASRSYISSSDRHGPFGVASRLVLAVLLSCLVCFPPPTCLAANTCPHWMTSERWISLLLVR